jgi:hypothetical protein
MGAGIIAVLGIATAGATFGSAGAASSPAPVAAPLTTAHLAFSVSVSGKTSSAMTIAGTAQVDFTHDAVSLTATLPAAVAKLIPGGTAAPEIVHAVFSGATIYVEIPDLAPLVGAPWISVALPAGAAAAVPGVFTKVASALGDVNEIIRFARAHHTTVSSLGTATIDGVTATGTRIVATLSGKEHTRTLTAAVWADASDRLVQGTVTVSGTGSTSAAGLTATVNVSDDGAPVTITVPPPSQVKSIPFSVVARLLARFLHGHHGGHHHRFGPALAS